MAENETINSSVVEFSHEELMEITITALNELLAQDNFLKDLPCGVTLEEVNNQIALQHGKSITVYVMKEDGEKLAVVVPQSEGKLSDLKKSIKRCVSLKLNRLKSKTSRSKLISWKYIWKTYNLQHYDNLLIDDNSKLVDLGIKNRSYVYFLKKRKKKN